MIRLTRGLVVVRMIASIWGTDPIGATGRADSLRHTARDHIPPFPSRSRTRRSSSRSAPTSCPYRGDTACSTNRSARATPRADTPSVRSNPITSRSSPTASHQHRGLERQRCDAHLEPRTVGRLPDQILEIAREPVTSLLREEPSALTLDSRDRNCFAAFQNQLDRAVPFALLVRGEQDRKYQQHTRGAARERPSPLPALDPRDHAAGQDCRNMNPLAARVMDGLGRAQQRMIRAQTSAVPHSGNAPLSQAVQRRPIHRPEPVTGPIAESSEVRSSHGTPMKRRPDFPARHPRSYPRRTAPRRIFTVSVYAPPGS